MNAIFFGLKRAYQSSLRVTRRALKRFRLTSARFDMLYAVLESPLRSLAQRQLRELLGVTAPTVSRMVTSLEQLGFVRREKTYGDRRMRTVFLTDQGLRVIRRARSAFIRSGWAQLVVDTGLAGKRWWDLPWCFLRMSELEDQLRNLRHEYLDTGSVFYPWHPDD
jgi:DNA-binding MarR family transcriptional regulator